MKRRPILLLGALAALVALGVVTLWPRGPREPVYQGRRLGHWIREACREPEVGTKPLPESRREAARKAVQAIGPDALPYLLSQFDLRDSRWTSKLKRWASSQRLIQIRLETDSKRLASVNAAFYLLGSHGIPAVPFLLKYVGDEPLNQPALHAIAACGTNAFPILWSASVSNDTVLAENACQAVVSLARTFHTWVPCLIQMQEHPNSQVRRIVAAELSRIGLRPDLIVPALTKMLSDPDEAVRGVSAGGLAQMGRLATPAVPALLRLMNDPSPYVVSVARDALSRIDPSVLERH